MIGLFDSGVGGLGILAEVRALLPEADLVYVADHDFAPYGERDLLAVRSRCEGIVSWMKAQGCGAVTIACNTASAAALSHLRGTHPDLRFIGMEPAIKPAAASSDRGKVGIVATAATFQGELFASVVDRFGRNMEMITAACPTWVELVEAGLTEGDAVEAEVRTCLGPLLDAEIDVLVLACTHYPALADVIAGVLGPAVEIIDPAPAVARQTARVATDLQVTSGEGRTRLWSTRHPGRLANAARRHGLGAPTALLPLP